MEHADLDAPGPHYDLRDYLAAQQVPLERLFLGAPRTVASETGWSPHAELELATPERAAQVWPSPEVTAAMAKIGATASLEPPRIADFSLTVDKTPTAITFTGFVPDATIRDRLAALARADRRRAGRRLPHHR